MDWEAMGEAEGAHTGTKGTHSAEAALLDWGEQQTPAAVMSDSPLWKWQIKSGNVREGDNTDKISVPYNTQ